MNFKNFKIEKEPAPSTDWRVFGEVYANDGSYIGSFGEDGTSVNLWWVSQDIDFQSQIVNQFAIVMAQEMAAGTAE